MNKTANDRIRVLIISDEMEVGGTQRQIVHIAKGLDRKVFEPTVAYFCNRSFLVDDLERAGVPVVEIPKRARFDLGFVRRLAAFVRDGRFDVVHCFSFTGELWGTVACKLVPASRRPVLITSVRNKYDWYSKLQWRLKRWASLNSATVIANSRAGGEHARETMRLPSGSVEVVYNGVADAPPQALATLPLSTAGAPVTAQFVGRLVEQKNLPVLLRAMKRLKDDGVPLRLRVAGDGPLRAAHEELIAKLGVGDVVEMLGERSDTPVLMAQADFVVLPSVREGLSNVILEAMVMGRAVIATAVGGSVELVEPEQTGLLVPSDDDAALAQAIRRLVEDRALREAMGARGRQRAVERFTVPAMVRAMQDAYQRCLSSVPAQLALRKG
jgi:glycosyltransferase involved in cell wall biosynthesis